MRSLRILIITLTLLACNANKNVNQEDLMKPLKSKCPDDGICTFEVLKNKTLSIKKDGIGATYPEISAGNNTVLKFEYIRNEIANTQDSGYRELIYVEFDKKLKDLKLENKSLGEAKVTFGRLCFCRGQTGYYPVKQGTLSIMKNGKDEYDFKINFKIDEVPQIITSIEESFKL